MTETPSETTDLKAQYTAQVSADLERNAKEQERLRQEIDALQEQLQSLQQDRSVLANMQQALGVVTPGPAAGSAAEPVSVTEEVAAPSVPRQKTATPTATATAPTSGKRTRAKKAPAPQTGKQAKKPAATKPKAQAKTQAKTATAEAAPAKTATAKSSTAESTAAKTTAAKPAPAKKTQPTLVELIRRHLTEQSEPRSAAEVATALTQAHPDRRIQTNVVRTTLEGLVAKSNAQRTRQGSSVYYTAPDTQEPAQDQPREQHQASSEAAESE
ncbi:hypothetical protein [Streptomyces griseiscabiei]|uniref:Regulatory protein n=1 Tax=Streptomyces griseiscabiei TaxID=2993540 RepID=A0ABU4L1X3_9ACTN|nr:hypothetical protein [Streptomyces griseiscabiei]MBZ3905956.1 hypothetical protein [Streptomyces griseiscabiei]MDX2909586.1 hypothetical protein [Streptomyces griseiscabiei]